MPTISYASIAKLFLSLSLSLSLLTAFAQTERQTTVSDINLTVNNLGIIGNAFRGSYNVPLSYASCQYPARSGVEHLFDGGLWVGAKIGGQPYVTSGAIDASGGYAPGVCNFEFTTQPNAPLSEISSLVRSPSYNPRAVSHQDFSADFTDRNTTIPGTSIQVNRGCSGQNGPHRPLGIDVHMETYNWNYSYANFFVILNYTIKNVGNDTLRDFAFGYWADGVVRNVNKTPPGGTPFFDKGGNGYVDSLGIGYEFDAGGDLGFTESYFGLKFLGADLIYKNGGRDTNVFVHPLRTGQRPAGHENVKLLYNTWQFNSQNPNFFTPNSENERYLRLTTGLNERSDWDAGANSLRSIIKQPSNRSNLISVAGIPMLAPGQSMRAVFAVVCARKREDGLPNVADTRFQKLNLINNAFWAQTTFNGEDRNFNGVLDEGEDVNLDGKLNRFTLPEPPATPIAKVVAGPNSATLYWQDNAEQSLDPITQRRDFRGYRIYKTKFAFDQQNITDVAGSFQLHRTFDKYATPERPYLTPLPERGSFKLEGDSLQYQYKLTIDKLTDGWQHAIALTAYDSGNAATQLPSLESAPLDNIFRVFPGTLANPDVEKNEPFAYPNPYYGAAAWEGGATRPEERKIYFANLPRRAEIRVMSQSGDLIVTIVHNGDTYKGEDAQWFTAKSEVQRNVLSGGVHAWDLLSGNAQIIARGVYLFAVKDLDSGKETVGKFTIIK